MATPQFKDKVIAVTGAGQGMGLATAIVLAQRGASVSIADINAANLDKAKEKIQSEAPRAKVFTYTVDVSKEEAVEAWIRETVATFGRLDGAANVAGVVPDTIHNDAGLTENLTTQEFDFMMNVNAKGVMYSMKYQLREIKDGGSIVNVSSIAGLTGRPKNASYAASKHAVLGLSRSAAKEVGPRGVRVNAICPGRIATPMLLNATALAAADGETQKKLLEPIALKRDGTPEEVAKLIAFLLSSDASYITGASISIDGGWNC